MRKQRRYYLHQRIKLLVRYDARKRTCYIPVSKESILGNNKSIIELRDKFKYNLQLEID